jgi:hypothetical protein
LPGNQLSFFKSDTRNGILAFVDDQVHEIVIIVGDMAGNTCSLRFWVKPHKPDGFVQVPVIPDADSTVAFRYNRNNKFETDGLKVDFPVGSLYEDMIFRYSKSPRTKGLYSDIHFLHDAEVPIHSRIKVSVMAVGLPEKLRDKALISRVSKSGKRSNAGGSYGNGYVTTTTNVFGGYAIVVDTVPPVIRPSSENKKSRTGLRFTVSDNFSGISSYSGEVNGQWALVEWDAKNRLMSYRFDQMAQTGKNTFTLFLEDDKGNRTSYSTTFTR